MTEFPYMPLFTDAYLGDTLHLSTEEHGAYLLLLMATWRSRDCHLEDDDTRLARMAGVGIKKWTKMRPVIEAFFTVDARGWTQKRLLSERSRAATLRDQKSRAGKASALKRKETTSTDVSTEGPTKGQPPIPIPIPSSSVDIESTGVETPFGEFEPINGDWKGVLFGPVLLWLSGIENKPPNKLRSMLGKWLSMTGNDASAVVDVARAAKAGRVAAPVDWITAHLGGKKKPDAPSIMQAIGRS